MIIIYNSNPMSQRKGWYRAVRRNSIYIASCRSHSPVLHCNDMKKRGKHYGAGSLQYQIIGCTSKQRGEYKFQREDGGTYAERQGRVRRRNSRRAQDYYHRDQNQN